MDCDIIVIGAGISGLYAAHLLRTRGFRVHLLEARDRLGGRLHTIHSPEGHPVDLGGQWVGPQHTRLLACCQAHNIALHPTYFQGKHRLITAGRTYTYRGTIPRLPLLALLSLGKGLYRLRRAARRVSLLAPWNNIPEGWDALTLAAWRSKNLSHPLARAVFDIGMTAVLGCEPEEVSFWHVLFYIQSAGSLEALIETEGGAQAYKFAHGAASLVAALAEGLSWETGQAVWRVVQTAEGVQVETVQSRYRARAVVVAIPPALTARIEWEPSLPPLHQQLAQRMPMGSVTKVVAIYERPFWREEGWSGHFLRTEGAIRLGFDTSPPDGSYGQITAFGVGPLARNLLRLSPEARQAYYENEITHLWGKKPRFLYQKSWTEEPWSGGCYAAYFGPGGWTYFGQVLHTHLPPFFWAGTERSTCWMGYIEGALHAAEKVAEALLQKGS